MTARIVTDLEMSRRPRIMVRGIFTTALTRLLREQGFLIVVPSMISATRFGVKQSHNPPDVFVADREDRQGVYVEGEAEQADTVIEILRKNLLDVVIRERTWGASSFSSGLTFQGQLGRAFYDLEFPAESKKTLDSLRNMVVPTMEGHHKFKVISPHDVDDAEGKIGSSPQARDELAYELKNKLIYKQYAPGTFLQIEHVKPNGHLISLREGEILGYHNGKVFLKRKFHGSGSFYDGFEVPKEEGDYGITEAQEDLWSLRHSYFGSDGQLKGELYNINTPVEFYPGKIRYVDLEVDVVKPVGQGPRIIDKDKLTEAVEEGHLNERLATKVFEIGQELLKQLRER